MKENWRKRRKKEKGSEGEERERENETLRPKSKSNETAQNGRKGKVLGRRRISEE